LQFTAFETFKKLVQKVQLDLSKIKILHPQKHPISYAFENYCLETK